MLCAYCSQGLPPGLQTPFYEAQSELARKGHTSPSGLQDKACALLLNKQDLEDRLLRVSALAHVLDIEHLQTQCKGGLEAFATSAVDASTLEGVRKWLGNAAARPVKQAVATAGSGAAAALV